MSTYSARMPSDKTTVATTADFAPTVVGGTDRERSIVSSAPRAHDGTSQRHRPEVHQTQFNVLLNAMHYVLTNVNVVAHVHAARTRVCTS